MALRRAYADEFAERVNRAAVLLRRLSPADAVRALQAEFGLSERQARRYVNAGPERPAVFTVRLAPSLIGGLRGRAGVTGQTLSAVTAEAVHTYLAGAGGRGGGQAS